MADTGKQSPLGVNALGSLLQNIGMGINPQAESSMGISSTTANYTLGTICDNTCLRLLTYAINDAYSRGQVDIPTYANLISIGTGVIPALGNSPPATYTWTGAPGWNPYTGVITSWGYIKLFALQAHNEFNYNETLPEYRDFLGSMNTAYSFVKYSNNAILSVQNSKTFLQGTYSNMNDLISADVTGVTLATATFGQDFISAGKAIDLASISTFGLPSNLLMTLQRYNALTKSVSLALLATGMTLSEITEILGKVNPITTTQERFIYAAFTIILGQDLADVCIPLNCKTTGLDSLADLLNPMKLFPNSYTALTVPVYNASPGPTNSKTYYPIYGSGAVNARLSAPAIVNQIGTHIPPGIPVIRSVSYSAILGQGGMDDAAAGFSDAIASGNYLGALGMAGTSYNTFKNQNLGQILKGDVTSQILGAMNNVPNFRNIPTGATIGAAAANIVNKPPVVADDIGSAYPSMGAPIRTGSTTATGNGK